jgi:glycosyltransferase involved in cell wall biosynthesis
MLSHAYRPRRWLISNQNRGQNERWSKAGVSELAHRKIAVVFPEGRGVARWQERNVASPVPGAWPYGLEHLADGVGELTPVEAPPLSRLRSLLARRRVSRPAAGPDSPDVALAWDEATALRMAGQMPAGRMLAGIIWVTDAVVAGAVTATVRAIRSALRTMDGLWVLSRAQQDAVAGWLGPASPPVEFLPFGVDETFYAVAPYPDEPLVLSIGGDRDRDPATLFAALAAIRAARPGVRCVVQSSSDLAPPAGIEKFAHIPHDEVRRLYARASVVAIPTRPNLHVSGMTVGLEAMSTGRPVVASVTPGMTDYVTDGVTGRLVPPGDATAVADAVLGLLDDPDAAATMGTEGRRVVEEGHTTATMCRHLLEILAKHA